MNIRTAKSEEVGIVLQLIHDLAHYEKAPHEVEATEKELLATLFSEDPKVFCDVVEVDGEIDRKSTRLNSSHVSESRMPSSA